MTAKQRIIEFISSLPDDLNETEIEEHWHIHQRIQDGIRSAQEEPLVDHEDLPELMAQWISDA